MSQHLQKIFDVWDGNAETMATDIGDTGVNVRAWRNRGNIHSDHWPKIIKAAWEKRGTVLRLEDFLPADVVADLPGHGAPDSAGDRSASATNSADNIGGPAGVGQAPFTATEAATAVSSSTCSTTSAHPQLPLDSPGCSTGPQAKAA